ncbi:Gfo/Idh/MocA family oxidoreductase [Achromobacter spanius]|uniref:Gfo/Idh/MocA family protein n=1 Tax=Achromobacter spanius TaxID=217203 RepID=UPI002226040C|nr:Gfo/Idh/MocA family oxidoreductase [Achromobacter spanius]MCW3151045.1 Gfo/Idh/MocA family oxidoreductase [Achromobacter spanius]
MKVLVIGSGSIGRRHIDSLKSLRSNLSWVLLRSRVYTDALSTSLNAIVHDDIHDALAEEPDLAIVASPSSLHIDVLPKLLETGIPLYVEKPVVTHREQLDRLNEAVSEHGGKAPTLMGCNLRFLPALAQMRQRLLGTDMGAIVRGDFQAGQWLPDWRPATDYRKSYSASPALGGGVMLDLIHEVDAARWLLGEFDHVKAFSGKVSSLEIQTEDVACMTMRARQGTLVTVSLDYISRQPLRRYLVVTEAGNLVCDLIGKTLYLNQTDGQKLLLTDDPADFNVAATYPSAMAELLNAWETQQETSQPLAEGIASLDLLLRAREDCLKT